MPNTTREIFDTCRFCLSQDTNILIPIPKITGATLTIEDIERFTSIPIREEECVYAICETCRRILETSTNFRRSCLSNDIIFNQLFAAYVENFDEAATEDINDKKTTLTTLEIEILLQDDGSNQPSDYTVTYNDPDSTAIAGSDKNSETELKMAISSDSVDKSKPVQNTKATKRARRRRPKPDDIVIDPNDLVSDGNDNEYGQLRKKKLCNTCGALVYDLLSHARIHSKAKRLTCSLCPIKMANRANLLRHVQAVHVKKILKSCELCDKGFTSNNSYKSHMRTHHGIGETYECKICCRTFNHPSNYKEHVNRLHDYKKNFRCRACGKLFKERSALKAHRRVHSSSKPFACKDCPKRFKSRYARNTHQITHTGIRFQCEFCEKSYQYKQILVAHCKKHHPDVEPAKAADCSGTQTALTS